MKNLNLFGPVTTRTGYGVFVTNLARELSRLFHLTLTPRSEVREPILGRDPVIIECIRRAQENFDYSATGINIWHAHNMQQFHSGERIGFPIFEGELFKQDAKSHLLSLDRIAVTSKWAANVVKCNLDWPDDKLCIINGGIDPMLFNDEPPISIPVIDQFTGLKAVNIGKWEVRKGHPEIIRALAQAKPELTFFGMWDNPFFPRWKDVCQDILEQEGFRPTDNSKAIWRIGPNTYVVLVGWIDGHSQYAQFIKKMDFGIFPYRAEGWCLPLHECMGCGLPVIATDYSAPTEFLTDECGILLKDGKFSPIYDQVHFPDGGHGNWLDPNQEELNLAVSTMTEMDRTEVGRAAYSQAHKFTWEAAAIRLAEQL